MKPVLPEEEAPQVEMPAQAYPYLQPLTAQPILTAGPRDYLDRPSTLAGVEKLYKTAEPTYQSIGTSSEGRYEDSMYLNPQGIPSSIYGGRTSLKNRMEVPTGSMAVVHTHPYGAAPQPSPPDFNVANQIKGPNFEVSRDAIWAAMPGDNKPIKVADVKEQKGHLVFNWVK